MARTAEARVGLFESERGGGKHGFPQNGSPRPLLPSRSLAPPRSDVVCFPPLQVGYDADMAQGRRRRGFERVGRLPASQLGLPPRLARELLLAAAWLHVAGETIAGRAAVQVRRGVLEIRVQDERWAAMISELIPRIAGRMAAAYPQLGVRKFRMQRAGDGRPARATTIEGVAG